MSRFELWILKRIVNKYLRKTEQYGLMRIYYGVLISGCRKAFYEDNKVTLDSFLQERLTSALDTDEETWERIIKPLRKGWFR